jgi:hypothetical protein
MGSSDGNSFSGMSNRTVGVAPTRRR